MGEPIEMPFGLTTRMGPRNYVLDGGPDLRWERAILGRKGLPILKYRDALPCTLQKMAEIDRDAVWIVNSGVPKEQSVRWGPDPLWEGAILWGKGLIVK